MESISESISDNIRYSNLSNIL